MCAMKTRPSRQAESRPSSWRWGAFFRLLNSTSGCHAHQLLEEILMVPADEDHLVALQQVEDEALQHNGLPAAVEEVAGNQKLVRFRIVKISGFRQHRAKRRVEAVDVGCDIVFHDTLAPFVLSIRCWISVPSLNRTRMVSLSSTLILLMSCRTMISSYSSMAPLSISIAPLTSPIRSS